jgi:hypothetical protein
MPKEISRLPFRNRLGLLVALTQLPEECAKVIRSTLEPHQDGIRESIYGCSSCRSKKSQYL